MGDPDPLRLSHSALSSYQRCPRRWKLERIDHLKVAAGHAAEEGALVHRAIARLISEGERPIVPRHLQLLVDRAAREALTALEHGGRVMWVEEPITWRWDLEGPEGPLRVTAMTIPDLVVVDGAVARIWDWKTGWKGIRLRRHRAAYEEGQGPDPEESHQGLFACLGVSELEPEVEVFEFRLVALRQGVISDVTYDLEDLEIFREELEAWAPVIAADREWRPKPGDQCRLCPFSMGACDAGTQLMRHNLPVLMEDQPVMSLPAPEEATPAEAERIGRMVAFLDRGVVAKLKAWLAAYTELRGPVDAGGGKLWGHWPRSRAAVTDALEVVRLLAERGVDPFEVFTPDLRVLGSYVTGRRRIPGLDRLVVFEPGGTYFGLRNGHPSRPAGPEP